ncbi:DegV family protein [Ornithinimicrobium sp. INDO-MA30-4]|uniref:DegV family protein n=1 Tax=Ornithinimicrobium sp. INDO-MA30-4 TaxID=2908651 RepID=UPI0021A52037|nr:DegV family protein [Ornithinimicrobium sp. INDO-MA30-4]
MSIAVHHFAWAQQADLAASQLREALPDATVDVVELGAVTAVHTGPGTLAVVVSSHPM